jgi:phosphopantothenoylcysteine decarboxylase/phosphopantothenate--cysteine ligase
MNTNMWNHLATQSNAQVLRARGHVIVEPGEGLLACGTIGPGRLAEPVEIADAVLAASKKKSRRDLEGETILITAGPTQEPIDGVRYMSNRSSGKMGYALAEEAAARGAHVVLVSGPVSLVPPREVIVIPVRTALEMRQAVMDHLTEATIVIKAAAVADYHIPNPSKHKLKKTAARLSLDLEHTPDILAELGTKKGDRLLIGFAAETDNMLDEARRKMQQKNCDMVVGNVVSSPGIGFDSDENEVVLVTRAGETIPVQRASKRAIAGRIFDEALRLRLALHVSR